MGCSFTSRQQSARQFHSHQLLSISRQPDQQEDSCQKLQQRCNPISSSNQLQASNSSSLHKQLTPHQPEIGESRQLLVEPELTLQARQPKQLELPNNIYGPEKILQRSNPEERSKKIEDGLGEISQTQDLDLRGEVENLQKEKQKLSESVWHLQEQNAFQQKQIVNLQQNLFLLKEQHLYKQSIEDEIKAKFALINDENQLLKSQLQYFNNIFLTKENENNNSIDFLDEKEQEISEFQNPQIKCRLTNHEIRNFIGVCTNRENQNQNLYCQLCIENNQNYRLTNFLSFECYSRELHEQVKQYSKIKLLIQDLLGQILILQESMNSVKIDMNIPLHLMTEQQVNDQANQLRKLKEFNDQQQSIISQLEECSLVFKQRSKK